MLQDLFEQYSKLSTNRTASGMSKGLYVSLRTYLVKYSNDVTEYSYTTFLNWLTAKELATNSKALLANSLGRFFWINSIITKEEFDKLKSAFRSEQRVWSGQHVSNNTIQAMLGAINTTNDFLAHRDKLLILLLAISGLRVSEITAINVDDVVFNNNLIIISVFQRKSNRGLKNDQKRTIKLNDNIELFGIKLKSLIKQYLSLKNEFYETSKPLFISQKNQRLRIRTVQHIVKQLAETTGATVTPHTFRHEAVTRAVNKFGIHTGAILAGHSSIQTTMKYTNPKYIDIMEAYDNYEQNEHNTDDN